MKRLAYLVTHGVTAKLLLRGQLRFMRERGYEVTVIGSRGPELDLVADREGVRTIGVTVSREVNVAQEPRAAREIFEALRTAKPDILNASTPKASVLGLVAARALGVPARVYLLRGLRLEGARGPMRAVLSATERVASACAHHVVSVSESLKRVYVKGGYAAEDKMSVIPSNGIDLSRFLERSRTREAAAEIRARYAIPDGAIVAGFVGRLVRDKGAADMAIAVERAAREVPELRFLMVGGDLAGDALPADVAHRLANNSHVIRVGTVADPAPYYAAMDFLVFPSFREGLPNVPLEAAACELPSIGYRSTGIVDAISHGETGTIVDRGDTGALADAIVEYARATELRVRRGQAARQRVLAQFTNERTWAAWAALYDRLLAR